MAAPTLRTPRTVLRPLAAADVETAHAVWTNPDVRRYLWDDVLITRERAAETLARSDESFASHGYGLWAIHQRPGGPVLGFCGCQTAAGGEAELLYGLLPAWWGQGLATECAGAVLDHLFGALGRTEAVAMTDVANAASVRVMERLGMAFERRGDHHGLDTLFYRLRSGDWTARRIVVRPATPARRGAVAVVDAAAGRLPASAMAVGARDRSQRSRRAVRGAAPPRARRAGARGRAAGGTPGRHGAGHHPERLLHPRAPSARRDAGSERGDGGPRAGAGPARRRGSLGRVPAVTTSSRSPSSTPTGAPGGSTTAAAISPRR